MPTLNWIGKDKVVNHHLDVPFRTLEKQYTFASNGGDDDGNMIIHGDNLDALKALLPMYEGRVKCIYIDPPYNTGNEKWVYNDNVNDPHIKAWLGKVVGAEGEDLSRHDKWLCMMYPRLKLLQKLLSDDGAIFISLDFHEQPVLRLILDEIFGASNYVSEIACVNKPSGRSDDKYIATAHESIIVYRKTPLLKLGGFEPESKITKRYSKTDDNGRFYREEDLRKRGTHDEREDRPNLFYPFFYNQNTNDLIVGKNDDTTPEGYIRIEPMKSKSIAGTWRWGRETSIAQKEYIHPRYMPNKQQWSLFEWEYLDERGTAKPTTLWDYKDVNSERGTEMFIKYLGFSKNDFPNPKPVGTIQRILQIATSKDSIILDSFAGSGTTAHAVLNMNKQDGGHRKFILVEMGDYAESITAERVRRVINGYGEGNKAVEGTGGGFSFYELGDALLINGMLNPNAAVEKIRAYVYYTETRCALPAASENEKYLLGVHENHAYYFYYEADRMTTLNRAFLQTIQTRAEGYLIYADSNTLSAEDMARFHITFKKIPRDIAAL